MTRGPRAVLDACVLIPMPLADTLLRLAEHPSLYEPKWSQEILAEVSRNLIHKWGMSPEKAARRESELRRHFPEAWVQGHQPLIEAMRNDPGDRHVLAAAFHSHSSLIVSYNLRHFPTSALEPLQILAQGPSTFLLSLYDRAPSLLREKLQDQAENLGVPIGSLFDSLAKNVPAFVARLRNENIG
jgi:hypothetical protein